MFEINCASIIVFLWFRLKCHDSAPPCSGTLSSGFRLLRCTVSERCCALRFTNYFEVRLYLCEYVLFWQSREPC